MSRSASVALAVVVALAATACGKGPSVSFRQDVQPVLAKHCAECHLSGGDGAKASGFEVGSYQAVMKGTKFGPVVVAGDPLSSSLFRLVSGKVDKSIMMPHGKDPLPPAELAAIENWIEQGAPDN
jgi:hypothetical protein